MNQAYNQLVERFNKLYRFQHLSSIASWDQSAMMPSGGNQARSEALAELSSLMHELITEKQVGDWIHEARENSDDPETLSSIREMERSWRKASVMPAELVKAQSLASSKCEHAWRTQRTENDWQGFSENLKEVVKLAQEEASIRATASGVKGYDAMLELYEPGMTSSELDVLFGNLKSWLPDTLQTVVDQQASDTLIASQGHYPTENQKALGLEVMELLGFDFNHGRLDVSVHPFCGGVSEDVRLTTRYNEADFVESLMGTIHETGHARYNQNLPEDLRSLPLGSYRSMGVHEGQSLFYEMQLGRSPAFLQLIRPLIVKHLANGQEDERFSQSNLEKIYNRVKPGYIRVDADEISYPLHVILRYEIEKALIEGDLKVDDLPQAWDEKMQAYLGLSTGENHSTGCMQDIHWPMGAFGYFPSYTLGAMYAAQQFATVKRQIPDVDIQVAAGNLEPVFSWLKENIWQQGSKLETHELYTQATGEPLNADHFKQHILNRYLKG
ncbi:carboxypeptidase M32 [Endozoicomonas arenosclerae]|uniref:carboxypeptidase M32 n=1 Tax=Endozoicomonas arenosclerae TaxID=1633495 RepID=UPI0007813785|nr:carboxypeptidase M32 [Endozoicomonas arenosclerae]